MVTQGVVVEGVELLPMVVSLGELEVEAKSGFIRFREAKWGRQ